MYYSTVKLSPFYHQMSFDELLFGKDTQSYVMNSNESNTRTYCLDDLGSDITRKYDVYTFLNKLSRLTQEFVDVYEKDDFTEYYDTFYIPKRTHGMRRIDAPTGRLREAQVKLRQIISDAMEVDSYGNRFGATYHTAAHAYIKRRSPKTCLERHKSNKSRWFCKFDFSNFFGSTTPDFLVSQLRKIIPLCYVAEDSLKQYTKICFLNGGLPQGTPISPLLTNIMMIPVDYALSNALRDFGNQKFVYTRYADDIQVSSEYDFDFRKIEELINHVLSENDAPFRINREKTRYGSNAGANWNLGMMYNKDCEITVGYRKKRMLKAMLTNYIQDKKNGTNWDLGEVQALNGQLSHLKSIEKDGISEIVSKLSQKFGADIEYHIREDLRRRPTSI